MPLHTLFEYGFVIRGFEAGALVALVAPLIGLFLVLRRYSLIADTLAHVSLAGVAIGALIGVNPLLTALAAALVSSVGIERLRTTKKVYGESALALFLSGSLALAVVLLGLAHGFNTNLFNYLFGSIVTVTQNDVGIMALVAVTVVLMLLAFYKELVYVTFDEEAARVSGVPARLINTVLVLLAALTVSLCIPVVGVLLIAALIAVPPIIALQFRQSFAKTILYAEIISLFSVLSGIVLSFYLDLASGGTIVLFMLVIFYLVMMRPTARS